MEEDISCDGGVLRRILCEGSDELVMAGDVIWVHYKGSLLDGTVFEESYKIWKHGLDFRIGKGQVILGWDKGLLGLRIGSKVVLTIREDYAYGKESSRCKEFFWGKSKILPGSTLVFEIHLLSNGEPPSEEILEETGYAQSYRESPQKTIENFNPSKELLMYFAKQSPMEAVLYIVTLLCAAVALLAAGWPVPWVVLWKGPFSSVLYLWTFWKWPWPWLDNSVGVAGSAGGTASLVTHVDDYGSCLYQIAWRMWLAWLAFLIPWGLTCNFIIPFTPATSNPDLGPGHLYGRLSKIYFLCLAFSAAGNLAMFEFLNTDCPLLSPRSGDVAGEGIRGELHTSESIWFGWSFVFSSRVLCYALMLSVWPLIALLLCFDDIAKKRVEELVNKIYIGSKGM
jgi:hypothetical protein